MSICNVNVLGVNISANQESNSVPPKCHDETSDFRLAVVTENRFDIQTLLVATLQYKETLQLISSIIGITSTSKFINMQ